MKILIFRNCRKKMQMNVNEVFPRIKDEMEKLVESGVHDVDVVIDEVEKVVGLTLTDKQRDIFEKIVKKRIHKMKKEKKGKKCASFTHGINVIIKEGSQKGKFGVQREYHGGKYELTMKALTTVVAVGDKKLGDKILGDFGEGKIVGEEIPYYVIDGMRVPIEYVMEIVSFKMDGKVKLGVIVEEEPIEEKVEEVSMNVEMSDEEILAHIEDLKESKKKLEMERESLYNNKLVGEGVPIEKVKLEITEHNSNISKIKDEIHSLKSKLKGKTVEVSTSQSKSQKMNENDMRAELEERRYERLRESLGVLKGEGSEKARALSTMERLKKGLGSKRTEVQRYNIGEFMTSTPMATARREASMGDLSNMGVMMPNLMDALESKMRVLYNVKEIDFEETLDGTSEEDMIRLFAMGLMMGKRVVYKNIYKVEIMNKYMVDMKRGVYTMDINYVPRMFKVEYNKTGMFERKALGLKAKGVYEVLMGANKGTVWNLVKVHPARIVVDTDVGIITNVMVKRGDRLYTEKLQPRHVFYIDLELTNGNMGQVNSVEGEGDSCQFSISEMTREGEINRVIGRDEIMTFQPGFMLSSVQEDEYEDEEYLVGGEEVEDEELLPMEEELKMSYNDIDRVSGEYGQLSKEEKQVKLMIDNMLKLVNMVVDYNEMMNMIRVCEEVKLKNETPFQMRGRIVCVMYYKFLKVKLSEEDINIKVGELKPLSTRGLGDVYEEIRYPGVDNEDEGDLKYITKYYSRVADPMDLSDDSLRMKESASMSSEDILSSKMSEMGVKEKGKFITKATKIRVTKLSEFVELLVENNYFGKKDVDLLRRKGKHSKNVSDVSIVLPLVEEICEKVNVA